MNNGVGGVVGVVLAVLIIASFFGAAVFLALYVKVSNWKATPLGRHTFWLSAGLTALTGLAVVSVFFHNIPGRTYIRLGSWAFLTFILWQRVWLLVKAFREGPVGRHRAAVKANEAETERLIQEGEDG